MTALAVLEPGDPRRVGRYRIVARLGAGGMGRVYLGRSPSGRAVAVKVVRPELADDPGFRRRFAREVLAAQRVTGFFTAAVVDAEPEGSPPWLATAYVPGISLHESVTSQGPWPEAQVRALGAGLAEALGAIHEAGVVHRDLKPSNVLIAADGPRVIDFGISVAAEASALTETGVLVGTPGFMSPEQLTGQAVGPASDVFSFGSVLAYAATGVSPFGTGPAQALNFRIVYEQPNLVGIPPALGVVARCLAKDPRQRPTVLALVDELAQALGEDDQGGAQFLAGGAWLSAAVGRDVRDREGATQFPDVLPLVTDDAPAAFSASARLREPTQPSPQPSAQPSPRTDEPTGAEPTAPPPDPDADAPTDEAAAERTSADAPALVVPAGASPGSREANTAAAERNTAAPEAPRTPESAEPGITDRPEEPGPQPPPVPAGTPLHEPSGRPRGRLSAVRRRGVLVVSAALLTVAALSLSVVVLRPWEGADGAPGASDEPSNPDRSSLAASTALLPEGAPAYQATQTGGAAYTNTYADGPSRRPANWKPWQAAAWTGDCVYVDKSLICTGGDGTSRLDAAAGEVRWTTAEAELYGQNVPAVHDGTVIVNSGDVLRALRLSDGKELWTYPMTILTQRLTVDGTHAYVTEHGGRVHAVNLVDGKAQWTFRPDQGNSTGSPPAVRSLEGKVYLFYGVGDGTSENVISVLDPQSGDLITEHRLDPGCELGTAALAWEAERPILYCLTVEVDPEAAAERYQVLRYDLKSRKGEATPIDSGFGGQTDAQELAVSDGRVFLVADGSGKRPAVVALDPMKRKELWRTELPAVPPGGFDSPPVAAGGRVYVAGDGTAAAFDPETGELLWRHEEDGALESNMDEEEEFFASAPHREPLLVGGVLFAPTTNYGLFSVDSMRD